MKYKVAQSSLFIDDKEIKFNSPIKDFVESDSLIIVLLKVVGEGVNDKEVINSSIVACDQEGLIRWHIKEAPDGGDRKKPYTGLYKKNNKVIAYNGLGFEYYLNVMNGDVKGVGGKPW